MVFVGQPIIPVLVVADLNNHLFFFRTSIESVTASAMTESLIRSNAGPDNTACVQQAYTSSAPASFVLCSKGDCSSCINHIIGNYAATFPFTSPMMFLTSATFAGRRLSAIAMGALMPLQPF